MIKKHRATLFKYSKMRLDFARNATSMKREIIISGGIENRFRIFFVI